MALRRKPTKSQLARQPDCWTVILRLGPRFGNRGFQWVPTGLGTGSALYSAIGATNARPTISVTVFTNYDDAYAAVLRSIKDGRRRMLQQQRTKSDWPPYLRERNAWSIVPVTRQS